MTDRVALAVAAVAVNVLMFAVAGIDKRRAIKSKSRIRERLMLGGGLLGGAGGILAAMVLFRHKTRKKAFRIGMPIMFFANLLSLYAALACMA